jgi:TonB-dependent starch-binding outer membrane protein SusC
MKKWIPKHVKYIAKKLALMVPIIFLSMDLTFAEEKSNSIDLVGTEVFSSDLLENIENLDKIVKGIVTDENGDPLPGASVKVDGTTVGTVTDLNGNYTINVPEGSTLVFSYIGFESQSVPVDNKTEVNISMKQDMSSLDEVVVVGYGTQRKTELTSSITRVTEKDFNKGNINDPIQLLQGKVAGLQIARVGGNPNQPFAVRLRGLSTLGANAEPLVIIDGVIGGSLANVDPNDIASIDVLKDASAGAIYGTRGSTGVIIVTTKSGMGVSVPTLEYSGFMSLERISNTIDIATREQFLEYGGTDYGSNTNWVDEVGRDALSHVHNFSYTGTSAGGLNYRASLNYRNIQGVVGSTGFDQLNGRINVSQQLLNDKLTLSAIVSITSRDANLGFAQALRYALTFNPTAPVFENRSADQLGRDPNRYGGYFETGVQDVFNPIALNAQNTRTSKTNNFLSNFTAEYEIINGWKIMANLSKQITNTLSGEFFANNALFSGIGTNGRASRSTAEDVSDLFELTTTYNRKVGDLNLNLLGGYSYQNFDFQGFSATNTEFITNGVTYNNLGLGLGINKNQASMSSIREESKLAAYFGRINLNYKDYIFLSSSLRREASSRFGANNRWGNFWALSGGVDIDKWFEIRKIDQLKLRVGYGVTGNEPAQRYAYLERLGRVGTGFVNGEFVPAIAPVSNPNPDLKWEEKAEFNIGLDFGFFNSKLSGTVDYFIRNTTDLLNVIPVPSPLIYLEPR